MSRAAGRGREEEREREGRVSVSARRIFTCMCKGVRVRVRVRVRVSVRERVRVRAEDLHLARMRGAHLLVRAEPRRRRDHLRPPRLEHRANVGSDRRATADAPAARAHLARAREVMHRYLESTIFD